MQQVCGNCIYLNCDNSYCSLIDTTVTANKVCPGWKCYFEPGKLPPLAEANKRGELIKAAGGLIIPEPTVKAVVPEVVPISTQKVKKRRRIEPVLIRYDPSRPKIKPFKHQQEAIDRFKDKEDIALFFEMGCGKSFTTLAICEEKFRAGEIKGLLVIAPNDVHRQWFDELVTGVDINHDGVLYQELGIDFEAQCVGGRGGQSELYPFETDELFKFVSVNVDTFSTPHKWEEIVFWANLSNYAIAIDEATSIKNPSSLRSQRLIYEFNDVQKRGKSIISSVKKHPVRIVLTGTPVTNGPMDLWAIMEFVHPNFFNRNYYSFRSYYGMFTKLAVTTGMGAVREVDVLLTEKTWQAIHDTEDYEQAHILFGCSEDTYMTIKHQDKFLGPYKHADELRKQLETVSIFKKLTDCVDMPGVVYNVRYTGMSKEQQAAYTSMKKDLLASFDGYTATAINKLVVSTRLSQISSGFIIGKKDLEPEDFYNEEIDLLPNEVVWLNNSNPRLDALMRDVSECDKPLLILTRYTAEASKIYELCDKAGYKTGLFTGWKVIGGIEDFKDGKLDVLVANSSKISRGFNLQIAHTTLFYSNTFSMEIRQQAEFRTFRMGQKHACQYIDYISSEVDETIVKALQLKKGLLEYMREKRLEDII